MLFVAAAAIVFKGFLGDKERKGQNEYETRNGDWMIKREEKKFAGEEKKITTRTVVLYIYDHFGSKSIRKIILALNFRSFSMEWAILFQLCATSQLKSRDRFETVANFICIVCFHP